jgi:hypothetical protein
MMIEKMERESLHESSNEAKALSYLRNQWTKAH